MSGQNFSYEAAYTKNIGWLSVEEQALIRQKRIAIPGMGGVGGHHLHNLVRLGFTKFNIADLDVFDFPNFNRQTGATCKTVQRPKVEVLAEMAREINPEADVRIFTQGVTAENADDFLQDVDLVIDGLDIYAMSIRKILFGLAYKKGIPVVTAGPFGAGTSVMAFNPAGLSFNDYFDLNRDDLTKEAQLIRFLVGMSPSMMHVKYLKILNKEGLFQNQLPSLNIGCTSATSACGALALKILLNRGSVRWAPKSFQSDFYLQKSKRSFTPWGNSNPWNKLKIKIWHRIFKKDEFLTISLTSN